MPKCSNCSTVNRDDSKYCKNCGASLTASAHLVCQKCSAHNPVNSLFCNRCGRKLNSIPPTAGQEPKPAAHQPQVSASQTTRAPAFPYHRDSGDAVRRSEQEMPDWFMRVFGSAPAQRQLIPTHELLRMANALGIDVDYSTLRFWQKRGLVPKPIRGPVSSGRGTRGYYEPSLIDRLAFIREIQKNHSLGLESIRDELEQIDTQVAHSPDVVVQELYHSRLNEMQSQRETESKRTLIAVLSKALGIDPREITLVAIEKSDGQTIRLLPETFVTEKSRST